MAEKIHRIALTALNKKVNPRTQGHLGSRLLFLETCEWHAPWEQLAVSESDTVLIGGEAPKEDGHCRLSSRASVQPSPALHRVAH